MHRSDEEKKKIVKEAEKVGFLKYEKQTGINAVQIYRWRKQLFSGKRTYKKKTPTLTTITMPATDRMVLLIGNTADVRYALEKLSLIQS